MNKLNWLKLIVCIVVFEGIGFLLGFITQSNIPAWYQHLNKSNLTPPDIAFPIVWTLLYGILAVIGFILWQQRHKPEWKTISYCFVVQMVMNWLWTPIFFYWHCLGLSFVWISLLTLLVFVCLCLLYPKQKLIALLLLPYFLWLCYASYLNGVIWWLNS